LPVELLIFSAPSHNPFFPILGTFTSSIAPPTPSTKQMQEAVLVKFEDLDIEQVLSQLSLFPHYFVKQTGVIEGNNHIPKQEGFLSLLSYIGAGLF